MYLKTCHDSELTLTNATSLELVEAAIEDMAGVLHKDHFLYTKASKWAFEEQLLRKNFKEARNYGLLCLHAYRKYKVTTMLFCKLPKPWYF
jgi:hypothetical protein